MTLLEIYKNINSDRQKWLYYSKANIYNILPFNDYGESKKAIDIIKQYLNAGSKLKLFSDIEDKVDTLENCRANHILSTYLLGIYFYDELQLETFFKENKASIRDRHDWLFIWYLTCLYHDFGYVFEIDKNNIINKNVKDFLPKKADLNVCKDLKNYDLGINYFKFRKEKFNTIDHGVVGGFRLYSILYRIYHEVLRTESSRTYGGLLYSEELLQLIGYAADAIIRHNMWNISDSSIRKQYHLEDLNSSKITLNNDPLTFLLGLCDTIEPIKHSDSNKECPQDVLSRINIDVYIDGNRRIINTHNQNIANSLDWLDVKIKDEQVEF